MQEANTLMGRRREEVGLTGVEVGAKVGLIEEVLLIGDEDMIEEAMLTEETIEEAMVGATMNALLTEGVKERGTLTEEVTEEGTLKGDAEIREAGVIEEDTEEDGLIGEAEEVEEVEEDEEDEETMGEEITEEGATEIMAEEALEVGTKTNMTPCLNNTIQKTAKINQVSV
jgi:hypothetical protein